MKMKIVQLTLSIGLTLGAALSAHADPQILYSSSNHKFTEVNNPTLGAGWQDEKGVVWYDLVVANEQTQNLCPNAKLGEPCTMTQQKAEAYCNGIVDANGTQIARLPSKANFDDLASFLGFGSDSGYVAEIIPNLDDRFFCSSSVDSSSGGYPWGFNGASGGTGAGLRNGHCSVRCVGR